MAAVAAVLVLAACEDPGRKVGEVRADLEAFRSDPTPETKAALEKSLEELDGMVARFEEEGDFVQGDLYRRQAIALRAEYRTVFNEMLKWHARRADELRRKRDAGDGGGAAP